MNNEEIIAEIDTLRFAVKNFDKSYEDKEWCELVDRFEKAVADKARASGLPSKSDERIRLGVKIPRFPFRMHQNKVIGNALDVILFEMEEKGLEVPLELMELKQWLRSKGNSLRENGDESLWETK